MSRVEEPHEVGVAAPLDPVISDAREKAPRTVAASARRGGALKRASTLLLWVIVVFFVALFAWISVAEVDTVPRAQGPQTPNPKPQTPNPYK